MRINNYALAALIVVATWSTSSQADFTVKQYHQFKKTVPEFNDYLVGLGRGVFWASIDQAAQKKPSILCFQDKNEPFSQAIILATLEKAIESHSYPDDTSLELVMVRALKAQFPCDEN